MALLSSTLVACVTVEETRDTGETATAVSTQPVPPITDPDGFDLGILDPKRLADGECGLFLFARNPSPRFVFFSNESRALAEMKINGQDLLFQRMSTAGDVFAQSFTEQTFRDPINGIGIELTLTPGDPMVNGHEVASGSMRLVKVDGWSMVIPVSGAAACQPSQ